MSSLYRQVRRVGGRVKRASGMDGIWFAHTRMRDAAEAVAEEATLTDRMGRDLSELERVVAGLVERRLRQMSDGVPMVEDAQEVAEQDSYELDRFDENLQRGS